MKVYSFVAHATLRDGDTHTLNEYLQENSSDDHSSGADPETAPPPAKRPKLSRNSEALVLSDEWNDAIPIACLNFEIYTGDKDDEVPHESRAKTFTSEVKLSPISSRRDSPEDRGDDLDTWNIRSVFRQSLGHLQIHPKVPLKAKHILAQCIRVDSAVKKSKSAKILTQISKNQKAPRYRLEVKVLWKNSHNMGEYCTDKLSTQLLELLYDDPSGNSTETWSPRDFYDNVHVPSRTGNTADSASQLKAEGLTCTLYPFQKRTTAWLLQREGAGLQNHEVKPTVPLDQHGFRTITRPDGQVIYVNCWLGMVTTRSYIVNGSHTQVRGGLLAEEMGLGKTVEIVSLLLLHQRAHSPVQENTDTNLVNSGATLIVCPVTIQQQWYEEIQAHAPNLHITIYDGMKRMMNDYTEAELVKELARYDVVLCSYTVLSSEIYYAQTGPGRSLRTEKRYESRKSPLVLIDWWRCVLDECQMVESGVSQAAQVVNQIPRQNAWAVSGTPLRKNAADLFGLLVFLRLQPYCYTQPLFQRLISDYRHVFKSLISQIALRHSKEHIRSELELPRQNRVVMQMPFTQIEEQHYATLYQEMCEDCGLSLEGGPLQDDWSPDDVVIVERMRAWLSRLRQTVLHPEVGERNRRALGRSSNLLRTVSEVLQVMTEQNDQNLRAEERTWLTLKLKRGQIMESAKLPQEALGIWLEVAEQARAFVDECRRQSEEEVDNKNEDPKAGPGQESTDDSEDKTQTRLGTLRLRLRSALEILHMATFFIGNAYYQLKTDEESIKPDSEQFFELEKLETDSYEKAKAMRKEILAESLSKAGSFMEKLRKRDLVQIPLLEDPQPGALESRKILEEVEALTEVMNEQSGKIYQWRADLTKLLLAPLVDQEEEELQGDEYETSTKQQDDQSAYYEGLRALVSDRSDHLTGQENLLIRRDMNTALVQARANEGPSPPLMLELLADRDQLRPGQGVSYFRGLILQLRGLSSDLEQYQSSRHAHELAIVNAALKHLRDDYTKQTKVVANLNKEVELFRDAMNSRLDFYRQLQAISDSVAPIETVPNDNMQRELDMIEKDESRHKARIDNYRSRGRYLKHLEQESDQESGPKNCIICQDDIEIGVLTSCGHQFCKTCLQEWYNAHRTCPVCKKRLHRVDFHQISYKPQVLTAKEELHTRASGTDGDATAGAGGRNISLYSGINSRTLAQIKNVDLPGSFGTKINTLARHIIWLRSSDPGAKSIVFSQFHDFLDILARAFKHFGIGFTTIDEKRQGIERFKKDSSVECFFLHAKGQASGLNLVNATHVFLCEPLINTAIELQAIARVHRIGQHSQTNVYMYLVEDTIEKAIYDISVERRMDYISRVVRDESLPIGRKRTSEDEIDKANSMEMEDASVAKMLTSGKGGGEMVGQSDLWACLFGVRAAGRAQQSADMQRTFAGFMGAEAAEQRALVERPGL